MGVNKLAILEYGRSLRGYENTHGIYSSIWQRMGLLATYTKMLCKSS